VNLYHRWMWFWCWACYRAYLVLPSAFEHGTLYRKFSFWLLGYAGAYAHSDPDNFYLCRFFYRSDAECEAAWDLHIAQLPEPNIPTAQAKL